MQHPHQHYRDSDSGEDDGGGERKSAKQARTDGPSAGSSTAGGGPPSRKPSGPPVKQACLACRKAKGKCDGVQPICGNCVKKGTLCEFVKSRRGGARKKKLEIDTLNEPLAVFLQTLENLGAYAAHQGGNKSEDPPSSLDGMTNESVTPADKVLKIYNGPDAILNGYYAESYPYAPILPAPGTVPNSSIIASLGPDVPYLSSISPSPNSTATPASHSSSRSTSSQTASNSPASSSSHGPTPSTLQAKNSPLLLALLCILVLVPHPEDPKPDSDSSRMMRRTASARYATESLRLVNEYTDRAGNEGDDVPLEVVQALVILAKWEMGQRGNFAAMRTRMGTATQVAMDIGLHRSDVNVQYLPGDEWKRDMRRRTWWMVFSDLMQSSVISGTLPSLSPYDPRVTAEFPTCPVDQDVWRRQMNTLRQVVRAFELVVSDKYPEMAAPDPVRGASPSSGSKDKKSIHQEMVLMDRRVLALLKDAEKRGLVEVRKGMGPEAELARNFALSTRMMLSVIEIVLHRSAAFPEVAIFSKRMCGMPAIGKAPPPSTMISRPIGDHQSAVLLNHFSTIAEEQARKRELEAASRPKPTKQSSSKESVSTVSSASHSSHSHQSQHQQTHGSFPAWTPPSAEPSVAGWTPSNGHRNGGPQNGQAYAPNVQQFDLASDASSAYAPTPTYPPPTSAYPAFLQQVYQTTPHLQQPFSLPYNQLENPAPPAANAEASFMFQQQPQAPPAFNFSGNGNGNGNGLPSQQMPSGAFDFSFGADYQFAPTEPIPKPWWEVDGGARAMIMPLEAQPFEPIVLSNNGSGIVGPGYPYSSDVWSQQMQGMGAPVPDISLGSYNPTDGELDRQRQFDALQHQQQQQHQRQPQQAQQPQRQASGVTQSPGSQTSSYGIRAVSEAPSVQQSEDSSAATSRHANLPWGLTEDLKPISQLVPPPKPSHKAAIKDTSVVGGLGASVDDGHIEEALVVHSSDEQPGPFPPGLSLARTSAAAHSVVRLEILHRSAQFSLLEGSPRALPFCACGLVSAAHAFLLLAVAIQAGDRFTPSTDTISAIHEEAAEQARRKKEVDGLYTNVKIIVAGLRKYGSMWEGINAMATEVQSALDKAQTLTDDMARYHRQASDEMDADGEDDVEDEDAYLPTGTELVNSSNNLYYPQGAPVDEFWYPQQGLQTHQ